MMETLLFQQKTLWSLLQRYTAIDQQIYQAQVKVCNFVKKISNTHYEVELWIT